jgi:hypothetical protein
VNFTRAVATSAKHAWNRRTNSSDSGPRARGRPAYRAGVVPRPGRDRPECEPTWLLPKPNS